MSRQRRRGATAPQVARPGPATPAEPQGFSWKDLDWKKVGAVAGAVIFLIILIWKPYAIGVTGLAIAWWFLGKWKWATGRKWARVAVFAIGLAIVLAQSLPSFPGEGSPATAEATAPQQAPAPPPVEEPGINSAGTAEITTTAEKPAVIRIPPMHRWDVVGDVPPGVDWTKYAMENGVRVQTFPLLPPATSAKFTVRITRCVTAADCGW